MNFIENAKQKALQRKSETDQASVEGKLHRFTRGDNYIAVVPISAKGFKNDEWAIEIFMHYIDGKGSFCCPKRTNYLNLDKKNECPLCNLAVSAYKKKLEEVGKKLYAKKRYILAVVALSDPTIAKFIDPVVIEVGVKIHTNLEQLVAPEGDKPSKIFKISNGILSTRFLNITRQQGQGDFDDYFVQTEDIWINVPKEYLEKPILINDIEQFTPPSVEDLNSLADVITAEAEDLGYKLASKPGDISGLFDGIQSKKPAKIPGREPPIPSTPDPNFFPNSDMKDANGEIPL